MLSLDFTFLFTLINLGVLYFFVNKFLFKKLGGFMDKRSADIADEIEKGKALVANGEEYLKQLDGMKADAEEECKEYKNQARREAEGDRSMIVNQARREAADIIHEAREEAAKEQQRIRRESGEQMAALAIAAASRVIEQNMDNDRNHELVQHFLDKEMGN